MGFRYILPNAETMHHARRLNVDKRFTEPPLVVEPEPVLVVGASVQEAIDGTSTDPINGGVVLDSSTTATEEGTARLNVAIEEATSEDAVIPPAGNRVIGPFSCKGMTGFKCCLYIKTQVPDADVNDR